MNEVARDAGVLRPTVYYFAAGEGLVAEVLARQATALLDTSLEQFCGSACTWEGSGVTRSAVTDPSGVPYRAESMITEWLSSVLCEGHPGARVLGIELGDGSSGTTRRRAVRVHYNDAGTRAAGVHGHYWDDPEFTCLRTPNEHQAHIKRFILMHEQCGVGLRRSKDVLPAAFSAKRERLWAAYTEACELASAGLTTFLHGDCDVANYYQTHSLVLGLRDWQLCLKGLWAHDLCYTLTSALSVENRHSTGALGC